MVVLGIVITVAGQVIRTVAMWTAGSSFTHLIAKEKKQSHILVTAGLYA
jgi:protein-S-isoprenylcysteine O-methyltransferase